MHHMNMKHLFSLSLLLLLNSLSAQTFYSKSENEERKIELLDNDEFIMTLKIGETTIHQYGHYVQSKNEITFIITAYSRPNGMSESRHPKKEIIQLKKRKNIWVEEYKSTIVKTKFTVEKRLTDTNKRLYKLSD